VRVQLSGAGTSTIVLISGLGGGLADWSRVEDSLALRGVVVAYDRPGLGASDPGVEPRSVGRMATELHDLLRALRLSPPFILCGHSLGGFVAHAYAVRYPHEVAGLLLVDPSIEAFYARADSLPEYRAGMARQADRVATRPPGVQAEFAAMPLSRAEVARLEPLPSIPIRMLISVHHGNALPSIEALWRATHVEWIGMQPQGSYVIDETSGHYIQRDNPQLVVANFDSLLATVRSRGAAPRAGR
jgi:pimeloyl-ACP methyl ester carboxylesterase